MKWKKKIMREYTVNYLNNVYVTNKNGGHCCLNLLLNILVFVFFVSNYIQSQSKSAV